jgi:hypothetical protein
MGYRKDNPVINCSNAMEDKVEFERWLNVEQPIRMEL